MMSVVAARDDPDVEAALLHHYGVRTRDVTLRELRVLVERLPPGAWPDYESPHSWSQESHLLAALIDAVQTLTWATVNMHVERAQRTRMPDPIPRPRPKKGATEVLTDMARSLGLG